MKESREYRIRLLHDELVKIIKDAFPDNLSIQAMPYRELTIEGGYPGGPPFLTFKWSREVESVAKSKTSVLNVEPIQ